MTYKRYPPLSDTTRVGPWFVAAPACPLGVSAPVAALTRYPWILLLAASDEYRNFGGGRVWATAIAVVRVTPTTIMSEKRTVQYHISESLHENPCGNNV